MAIIDSQVHAYEANTPRRPWHSVPNWPDHVTGDEMVAAMDAVTGPYDFIAVVDGQSLDSIGSLVTDSIGIIDGVTRTTTCVAVTVG